MAAPQSFEKQDSTVRGQDNTMDTNKRDEKDIGLSHKESFEHVELAKPEILIESMDEFGAHAKTDPREIALVKKLDRYIMVSFYLSYPPYLSVCLEYLFRR